MGGTGKWGVLVNRALFCRANVSQVVRVLFKNFYSTSILNF